jgi:hypothetical protein
MRNYLFSVLLLLTFGLTAQTNTTSPYSFYGIGLSAPQNGVYSQSMGGISQGLSNGNYINTFNPASYSSNRQVNFEFNVYGKLSTLHDSSGFNDYKTYNFGALNLAFPLGKKNKAGFSMGLMPYSYSGYNISQKFSDPTSRTDFYQGEGGLNKAYIGAAYKPFENISIGANVNYLFGDIIYKRTTLFDTATFLNTFLENETFVHGLKFDLGIQAKSYMPYVKSRKARGDDSVYVNMNHKSAKDSLVHIKRFVQKRVNDTLCFTWGLTFTPGGNISAARDVYSVTFRDYFSSFTKKNIIATDTIKYSVGENGKIFLPGTLALGFAISNNWKKTITHQNNFLIGADIIYSNWTSYRNFGIKDSLGKSITLRLGGFYSPLKSENTGYLNVIEYRAGAFYTVTPIEVRGIQVQEYGACVGVGLPIFKSKHKIAVINLGLEGGKMGTLQNNLTTDTYLKFSLGLNLLSDQWFQHYKYD